MSDKLGVCEIENCCGTTCDRSEVKRGIKALQDDVTNLDTAATEAIDEIEQLIDVMVYKEIDKDFVIGKLQFIKSCLE